jgi:hypothetical protein
LTHVGFTGLLCAASSYIVWGLLMQYIGFKNVYMIILVLQITIIFTFSSVSHNRTFYKAWISLAWMLETGYLTIIRPFIHSIYGLKIGNQINSLFLIGFGVVFLLIIVIANFLIPLYGWPVLFYI